MADGNQNDGLLRGEAGKDRPKEPQTIEVPQTVQTVGVSTNLGDAFEQAAREAEAKKIEGGAEPKPEPSPEPAPEPEGDTPKPDEGSERRLPELPNPFERKVEPEPEPEPEGGEPAPEPEPEERGGDPEDEHKEFIKEYLDNPHTPEKSKKAMQRQLGINNRLKKQNSELQAELESVKQRVTEVESNTAQGEPEALSDEDAKELRMLRRRYQVENDPEIAKEFEDRLTSTKETVNDVLEKVIQRERKHGDDGQELLSIEYIESVGGINKWAERNPDLYSELKEMLPAPDADVLTDSVAEMRRTQKLRERRMKEEQENADEYFKKKEEEQEKAQSQQRETEEESYKQIESHYNDYAKKLEWLQLKEENSKDAELNETNKSWNTRVRKYDEYLKAFLLPQNSEELAQTALFATTAMVLNDEKAALEDEISNLKGEIDRIKNAGRIRPPSVPRPPSTTPTARKSDNPVNTEDAFDRAVREKMAQKAGAGI